MPIVGASVQQIHRIAASINARLLFPVTPQFVVLPDSRGLIPRHWSSCRICFGKMFTFKSMNQVRILNQVYLISMGSIPRSSPESAGFWCREYRPGLPRYVVSRGQNPEVAQERLVSVKPRCQPSPVWR